MSRPPQLSFQLSYGDCDTIGIAYFGIYYPWMERAYSTWLFDHGIRSGELRETLGFFTVGVHSECSYLAMVRVFDRLDVHLTLDRLGRTSYAVGFDFRSGAEVVTHGRMIFACRSAEGDGIAVPDALRSLLETLPRAAVPA